MILCWTRSWEADRRWWPRLNSAVGTSVMSLTPTMSRWRAVESTRRSLALQRWSLRLLTMRLRPRWTARRWPAMGVPSPRLAEQALVAAGFTITRPNQRVRGTGVAVSFAATDGDGALWFFDLAGAHTTHRGGLTRSDVVWRALGRATALRGAASFSHVPVLLLTAQLPRRASDADAALRAGGPSTVFDVIDLLNPSACERLQRYAKGGLTDDPQRGFWTATELARRPRSPETGARRVKLSPG
jgi:hypothetical protein